MALNIKNQDVERLLDELVQITGESKTEAVRQALDQRRRRLAIHVGPQQNAIRLLAFLEDEVWPNIPPELLGERLTRVEIEAILGYGANGI